MMNTQKDKKEYDEGSWFPTDDHYSMTGTKYQVEKQITLKNSELGGEAITIGENKTHTVTHTIMHETKDNKNIIA